MSDSERRFLVGMGLYGLGCGTGALALLVLFYFTPVTQPASPWLGAIGVLVFTAVAIRHARWLAVNNLKK